MPSWDFFAEAADEETPGYKVETAKSARSKCTVCKRNSEKAAIADSAAVETSTAIVASSAGSSSRAKKNTSSAVVQQDDTTVIDKGDIRVGSLDKMAGSYGRWHHLECWRVPKKVQNGLTKPSDEDSCLRDLLSMVCWEFIVCVFGVWNQPSHSLTNSLSPNILT